LHYTEPLSFSEGVSEKSMLVLSRLPVRYASVARQVETLLAIGSMWYYTKEDR
jgi:hypothetical protein